MPEATYTHVALAGADLPTIWERLQSASTWSGFGMMDSVDNEVIVEGRLQSFDWSAVAAGKRHEGTAVVTESTPTRTMTIAIDSSELGGEITLGLEPQGDGTLVHASLTARSKGMLAGMFWGIISDVLQRGVVKQLDTFAASLGGDTST